jgi:hypothetical protein
MIRHREQGSFTGAAAAMIAAALLLPIHLSAFDSGYPEEPERFDSEYYLDLLTMREGRTWRALSDGTDNIFALDFGSLNVEQWVLLQSLKFSSELSDRMRLRYWLRQDRTLGPESADRNEIELEWNALDNYYLSFYLQPAFWKRENDIGIGVQSRDAIDSYRKIIFRVRDFANNFAYRHGDNIEGEENIPASPWRWCWRCWTGMTPRSVTRWGRFLPPAGRRSSGGSIPPQ